MSTLNLLQEQEASFQNKSSKLSAEKTLSFLTEKKYVCTSCDKSFSTSGNLKNHISTIHHNYRPFKCSFTNCRKEYSNQSRLKVHLRTHIGLKPFTCELCGKSFNEKGNLKTHLRLHSKERPFACETCGKDYKTNGHLKDHMNIFHLALKRFECTICGSKFGRSSTLKAHIRTHTGEKPYKCPMKDCGRNFAEKGNMLIHHKRHLKKQMLELASVASEISSEEQREKESLSHAITRPCSKLRLVDNNLKIENIIFLNIVKEQSPVWPNDSRFGLDFYNREADHLEYSNLNQCIVGSSNYTGIFSSDNSDESYMLPYDS